MSLFKRAAIVGAAESDLGVVGDRTPLQLQAQAAKLALEDAGIAREEVDGIFVSGRWPGVSKGVAVAEYLGIRPRYSDSTDIGGASFEALLGHAAAAIASGSCSVALMLYGSTQRSDRSRSLAGRPPVLLDQFEQPYGLPKPVGAYALSAQRHMHEYGTTREQLAEVAVATRRWAQLNPKAYKRDSLSIRDVLEGQMICDPLGRHDCCLVTDGGGALVIVGPDRAHDSRRAPVWLLGHGESHTHDSISSMPDLAIATAAVASSRDAFAQAGIGPLEIDVAQIYDSFTITVLLSLEAIGFCGRGEGGEFVSGQRTAPEGDFPMNTSGGGLSYCHPGMFGIFLLIEAVRQLRGECGARQVPGARIALAHGTGNVLSSAATCILGVD